MNLIQKIWFLISGKKPEKKIPQRDIRKVQINEIITIQYRRAEGGFARVKVINNNVKAKQILGEIKWFEELQNGSIKNWTETLILDYDCNHLSNFQTINPIKVEEKIETLTEDEIKQRITECLKRENYELAELLRLKLQAKQNK